MLPKFIDVFFIKVLSIFYLFSFIYCGHTSELSPQQDHLCIRNLDESTAA